MIPTGQSTHPQCAREHVWIWRLSLWLRLPPVLSCWRRCTQLGSMGQQLFGIYISWGCHSCHTLKMYNMYRSVAVQMQKAQMMFGTEAESACFYWLAVSVSFFSQRPKSGSPVQKPRQIAEPCMMHPRKVGPPGFEKRLDIFVTIILQHVA